MHNNETNFKSNHEFFYKKMIELNKQYRMQINCEFNSNISKF